MPRMKAPQRRRQLLEVGAKLFAKYGYRGTTTAELARAADITEPILYRHFENKLDLFVSMVEEIGTEVIEAWEDSLEGVRNPRQRLKTILASNPATHKRGKGVYRVIFQAMTEAEGEPDIGRALRRHLNTLGKFLQKELATLQKEGVVRKDVKALALAEFLMSTGMGYGLSAPLPGQGKTAVRESMEKLLFDLLTKKR